MQAHAGKNDNNGSREETRSMGTWNRSRKLRAAAMERGARVGRELTLLSQMAIELGSQWNRTWKSGFSLTNRTRSAASGVHEA